MLYGTGENYMRFANESPWVSTGALSTLERATNDQAIFCRLENELRSKTNSKHGGHERDGDRQRHPDGAQRRGSTDRGSRGSAIKSVSTLWSSS